MAIVALEKQTNISCIGSALQQVGLKKNGSTRKACGQPPHAVSPSTQRLIPAIAPTQGQGW
ncbi:Uncharacterised protein [Escherichia coli]|nr:Uncharacterised protein [Escherichia coli]